MCELLFYGLNCQLAALGTKALIGKTKKAIRSVGLLRRYLHSHLGGIAEL